MDLDLVGYMLGLLDPDERHRTESALRSDPAARRQLERLSLSLAPLEAVRDPEPPPLGLAERTVAFVTHRTNVPPMEHRPTPARRLTLPGDRPVFQPSRWRRADALIASAILVVLGGLGVSGLGRLQRQHEVTLCQNNLRQLNQALVSYGVHHDGYFPQVQERPPYNVAGSFVPMLHEAGVLPPGVTPDCPVVPVKSVVPPAGYAYSLGYRDHAGRLHGLRQGGAPEGTDLLPILSDRPRPISHGNGFNVLFIGGHVRFCTTPNVGVDGDDIFVNQASEVAAGLHRLDSVLGPSDTSP
jgi:prepilin-type processing-associated H-X9-DG protein